MLNAEFFSRTTEIGNSASGLLNAINCSTVRMQRLLVLSLNSRWFALRYFICHLLGLQAQFSMQQRNAGICAFASLLHCLFGIGSSISFQLTCAAAAHSSASFNSRILCSNSARPILHSVHLPSALIFFFLYFFFSCPQFICIALLRFMLVSQPLQLSPH